MFSTNTVPVMTLPNASRTTVRLGGVQAAATGYPAELVKEDVQRHQCEPELWRRHPAKGDHPDYLVGDAVAPQGGKDSKRYAKQEREHHRRDGELGGGRDVFGQVDA